MFDFTNLPPRTKQNVQIFYATGASDTKGFQSWYKPKGASMVFMFTLAGGGGGGGGCGGSATTARGGGASGAASGMARFLVPALFLPDALYIQVGEGGQGGTGGNSGSGGNGGNGTNSYILTSKTAVLPNLVCYSGANAPGGGQGGTSLAGGTAGAIPTIAVAQPINALGEWFAIVGLAGFAGASQAGANGSNSAVFNPLLTSPGANGAGTTSADFNGGGLTATALTDYGSQGYYLSGGRVDGGGGLSAGDINGGAGRKSLSPFLNTGGGGGAAKNSSQGGIGGMGGYGCGGGGGGGGNQGGAGGNGGDGVVIIVSW